MIVSKYGQICVPADDDDDDADAEAEEDEADGSKRGRFGVGSVIPNSSFFTPPGAAAGTVPLLLPLLLLEALEDVRAAGSFSSFSLFRAAGFGVAEEDNGLTEAEVDTELLLAAGGAAGSVALRLCVLLAAVAGSAAVSRGDASVLTVGDLVPAAVAVAEPDAVAAGEAVAEASSSGGGPPLEEPAAPLEAGDLRGDLAGPFAGEALGDGLARAPPRLPLPADFFPFPLDDLAVAVPALSPSASASSSPSASASPSAAAGVAVAVSAFGSVSAACVLRYSVNRSINTALVPEEVRLRPFSSTCRSLTVMPSRSPTFKSFRHKWNCTIAQARLHIQQDRHTNDQGKVLLFVCNFV